MYDKGLTKVDKRTIRGSWNYVMTAHTGSASDMLELENIRKAVKIINKEQKELESSYGYPDRINALPRYRVKCQGRGPRRKYAIADGKHPRAYDQSIPLSRAERMDVYVYQR